METCRLLFSKRVLDTHRQAPQHRLKSDHVRVQETEGYFIRQLMTTKKLRLFIRLIVFCQQKVIKLDALRQINFPSFLPSFSSSPPSLPLSLLPSSSPFFSSFLPSLFSYFFLSLPLFFHPLSSFKKLYYQ